MIRRLAIVVLATVLVLAPQIALTAPAPHHTRPARFVWLRDADRRTALLDRIKSRNQLT